MQKGFSILEILVSLSITLLIGGAVFQLFQQNERIFRDENLITEMQQGARAAIAQAASDIRMAGQGVPLYAATYNSELNESAVAILPGSTASRINFRAGLAPADALVVAPSPVSFTVGQSVTLTVNDASGLYAAVGGSPVGRFVYLWGPLDAIQTGWVRAAINSVTPSTCSVRITTSDSGTGSVAPFPTSPRMALEEAIALYLDNPSGTMKRTTATNMTDPINPAWAPANELMPNVTSLQLDYYDESGVPLDIGMLTERAKVAQVEIHLVVQTAAELSNHTRPSYAISVRTTIRNATIH
jgi:Tfp pilus assembly protein PilX